jgi:hypothetical protein
VASDDDVILTQLAELRRDVDQLSALRGDLREVTGVVADVGLKVDELAAAMDDLQREAVGTARSAWCWPDLDDKAAERAWETLTTWMRTYLLERYPLTRRELYPCWYRHPDAVDALSALFATWHGAYRNPEADPDRAGAWLERWLPAALRQLHEALHSCTRKEHVPPGPYEEQIAALFGDDFASAIAEDISYRPTRDG